MYDLLFKKKKKKKKTTLENTPNKSNRNWKKVNDLLQGGSPFFAIKGKCLSGQFQQLNGRGLYGGAAYTIVLESIYCGFLEVRLMCRAAYTQEITVLFLLYQQNIY